MKGLLFPASSGMAASMLQSVTISVPSPIPVTSVIVPLVIPVVMWCALKTLSFSVHSFGPGSLQSSMRCPSLSRASLGAKCSALFETASTLGYSRVKMVT